jgi:hypothetical protein
VLGFGEVEQESIPLDLQPEDLLMVVQAGGSSTSMTGILSISPNLV